jgi:hypothetical protein
MNDSDLKIIKLINAMIPEVSHVEILQKFLNKYKEFGIN